MHNKGMTTTQQTQINDIERRRYAGDRREEAHYATAMNEHTHSYRPVNSNIESCDCGASRVAVDAETQARRDAATVAFKQRYNAALAARKR